MSPDRSSLLKECDKYSNLEDVDAEPEHVTTLHERLYVGWRNQTHVVTELGDFTRPKMRPSAGLHPDQARRQLLEEPQHVSPTQLPADDRTAVRFSAMDLKCLLGQIQTDGGKPDIFN